MVADSVIVEMQINGIFVCVCVLTPAQTDSAKWDIMAIVGSTNICSTVGFYTEHLAKAYKHRIKFGWSFRVR